MNSVAHAQDSPKAAAQGRRGYACTFCRRRKFKCDGRNPCRSCIKGKQTCSYDNTSHRTPTQLLQDRIDELQSKIESIEAHGKSPRSPSARRPPSVPSQRHSLSTNGYTEGPYVFSSNDYPAAGPSRSLFTSASTQPQAYVADYVSSDSSSSCSSYNFGNYAPNNGYSDPSTRLSSPAITSWEPQPPAFEMDSPRMLDSQAGRDGTIPAPLAEKITFHFLTHRFRCGLLPMDRLQPQSLNAQRHPALLSACYLLGCFFCPDGSLAHLEPAFVERTRRALEDAIDLTQDYSYAIDYLLASSMLAQYMYTKGRLLEGYHRAISAIRFAVNHGFHEIKPLARDAISLQNPAHAQAVLNQGDRMRTWWHVWCIDRWGSLLTGLPCGIADADVQTPWPQADEDLTSIAYTHSIMSLYAPEPGMPDFNSDLFYTNGLKALALLERASVKASTAHTVAPELWASEHSRIQNALANFAASLESPAGKTIEEETVLSLVHIMVYAATCTLHMPYIRQWSHDESRTAQRNRYRQICREGAATSAAILHSLRSVSGLLSVMQGLPLAALCEYLLQERDDLIDELDFTEQAEVDKQLDEMMSWMHEMKGMFPVLGMQVDKLEIRRR